MIEFEKEDLKSRPKSAVKAMDRILYPFRPVVVADWKMLDSIWRKVSPIKAPGDRYKGCRLIKRKTC